MNNRYKKVLIVFAAILLAFFITTALFVWSSIRSLKSDPVLFEHQLYSLKTGANAGTVVDDLVGNPLEKRVDRLWLKFHEEYAAVQKGDYLVDGTKTLLDILNDMVQGNIVEKIYPTFPVVEGTNYAKIMRQIKRRSTKDERFYKLMEDKKQFMREIFSDDLDLLEFIGGARDNYEGLIAPATYPMYEKDPLFLMFKNGMIKQVSVLKKHWDSRTCGDYIKTPYDALIMASLIERETFLDNERAMVSSVFENRLNINMKLQTDPSVMYGVSPIFTGRLTRANLKEDTPYNTYTRYGLPPTPICMPREASIVAALNPAESNALYFVAKSPSPKDGHVFSSTLRDHNRAVAEYRQKVRDQMNAMKKSDDDDLIVAEAEAQENPPEGEITIKQKIAKIKEESAKESSVEAKNDTVKIIEKKPENP
ncbi:MAG: endolytic transglycosylase MltG [Succinivibrio sp.]